MYLCSKLAYDKTLYLNILVKSMEKISWTKEYQEDLSERGEDGSYDYAYRYYIYWFSLPDKQKIKARRYTDTPDHCSLFIELDDISGKTALEKSASKRYIFAIVNFLLTKEGVKTVDYYNMGYKAIDLKKVKSNMKDVTFEEVKSDK